MTILGFTNPFTGPAEALEIAGDFAYAYSGSFPASTTPATRLSFTTGNFLFVGNIRLAGMIDETTASNGRIATMTVKMNDSKIYFLKRRRLKRTCQARMLSRS